MNNPIEQEESQEINTDTECWPDEVVPDNVKPCWNTVGQFVIALLFVIFCIPIFMTLTLIPIFFILSFAICCFCCGKLWDKNWRLKQRIRFNKPCNNIARSFFRICCCFCCMAPSHEDDSKPENVSESV